MTEYIGEDSLERFGEVLKATGAKNIFLVSGKHSYLLSGAQAYFEKLKGIHIFHYTDFGSLPLYEDILQGIEVYKENTPDLVVAVGGGHVIDMAKAINALAVQPGSPDTYINGSQKISELGKPLVAIPTTSGSGSEATHFAVVYLDGKKYSLTHSSILPTYAIVDPALTYTLPSKLAAPACMDAVCQAIEAHWSLNATAESRRYAKEALLLALPTIRAAVLTQDKNAKNTMARAAHVAGKAINISKTTASHAMSYALTTHFNISHGHAVALTLPQLIVFNNDYEVAALLGGRDPEHAAQLLEILMHDIGLGTHLSEWGIKEKDIPMLVADMSVERASNNSRPFTAEDAAAILRSIL